ncbi:hypothetical protein SAMN02787142_5471 [Burkholderia sp. WP9]|uniref:hypothetical protein n=1 Tax=Burkholderia sp. WP9 TaxID=1500263 RepID=UPI00089874DA|nr:hypothetical protein [Burkholderia sp. WP9]SEE92108.1 hypothetical protein SAMN02787142_5471 [Burkholderia sp. WP9]
MLQLLAVNHFGAGELITFLAALLRDPDREGQRVQAFVFSDVVRLAKQHAVDRHVVDEPGPVGEVVPVECLVRFTPDADLRVELEALPFDHLGKGALDRVVMRFEWMANFRRPSRCR